jgi:hypothetical protein
MSASFVWFSVLCPVLRDTVPSSRFFASTTLHLLVIAPSFQKRNCGARIIYVLSSMFAYCRSSLYSSISANQHTCDCKKGSAAAQDQPTAKLEGQSHGRRPQHIHSRGQPRGSSQTTGFRPSRVPGRQHQLPKSNGLAAVISIYVYTSVTEVRREYQVPMRESQDPTQRYCQSG